MTFYALILFLHIAGAFFLFAGLLLEWVSFRSLQYAADTPQASQWLRLASLSARLYGPAIGLIILSGGYLGYVLKGWDQAWLPASFLTLVLVAIVGLVATAPRLRAIHKEMAEGRGPLAAKTILRFHDPVLQASVRFRAALVLGILFLMVSKVSLLPALLVLLAALVVGLVAAVFSWKAAQKAASAA
jgi:hypothetical protein